MKKLSYLFLILFVCTICTDAQKKKQKSTTERLEDAWRQVNKSNDSSRILDAKIKQLTSQKIIYRTKVIEIHDTIPRIDTCIAIISPVDSVTIAILFQNRFVQSKTKIGKKIYYLFNKKPKTKN